ncbi:MAG: tetratricopeptide repeat protein, partial [Candidatus Magnetominusculus sp. LBB02]|nr:tetratricopeptide repeat protein [Candidatus Magnetominusculus sp. LBB02]
KAAGRDVMYEGVPSHTIDEAALQDVIKRAARELWKNDRNEGTAIGAKLYDLINGNGGKLAEIINDSISRRKNLFVYLDVAPDLTHLPFELMHDGSRFIFLDTQRQLIRLVSEAGWHSTISPENRPLKMVFMACSPEEPGLTVLSYEKEEELIIKSTEEFALDIRFDDSGCVDRLRYTLIENAGCDILHITGHSGYDAEHKPIFYMEDETGLLDKVTPKRLWDNIRDNPPRMLFLSGCYTGGVDEAGASGSFACQMAKEGIPVVMGWGLPVSDTGATKFAAELYRSLSIGDGVSKAVQKARQLFEDVNHTWPLLRVFTNGEPLKPFITAGQPVRYHTTRTSTYEYLEGTQVKVIKQGFIGRRRELQRGVRAIKGIGGKYGVVIHGTGGNGKSCLAGKLIERFREDKELFVIHGEITEAKIVSGLAKLFDKMGADEARELLLSTDKSYEAKIKALFRGIFRERPVLIYFDDFEQNLIRVSDDKHVLKSEPLPCVRPFLEALQWAEHKTNLLITSRYPFELIVDMENLPATKLDSIPMMAFKDADLNKKIAELDAIANSGHKDLYIKYGGGNPRLLEWFEQIAKEEVKYDLAKLEAEITGKKEEFIEEHLAKVIAETAGDDFKRFLQRSAVYKIPVPEAAFKEIGDTAFLRTGVSLTLHEQETIGTTAHYWVTPVIRQRQWDALNADEKKQLHEIAYKWFADIVNEVYKIKGLPEFNHLQEAVHHALKCGKIRGACKYAVALGNYMKKLLLYHNKLFLQKMVADRVKDEIIKEAIAEKDEYVATLLNDLGESFRTLGQPEEAIRYYEKAIAIDLAVYDDKHPNVARNYNNLGLALGELGKPVKAKEYFENALAIYLFEYGEKHTKVAKCYNNLASVCDDPQKKIEHIEKALEIDKAINSDNHPEVANYYSNIGTVWNDLGELQKAKEYCEKALDIDLTIYGDKHPDIAIRYNNIGAVLYALQQPQKALDYAEKAYAIFKTVYGEDHPHTKNVKQGLELLRGQII